MQLKKLQGFAKRTLAVVLTVVMIFGSGINVLADETPVLPPAPPTGTQAAESAIDLAQTAVDKADGSNPDLEATLPPAAGEGSSGDTVTYEDVKENLNDAEDSITGDDIEKETDTDNVADQIKQGEEAEGSMHDYVDEAGKAYNYVKDVDGNILYDYTDADGNKHVCESVKDADGNVKYTYTSTDAEGKEVKVEVEKKDITPQLQPVTETQQEPVLDANNKQVSTCVINGVTYTTLTAMDGKVTYFADNNGVKEEVTDSGLISELELAPKTGMFQDKEVQKTTEDAVADSDKELDDILDKLVEYESNANKDADGNEIYSRIAEDGTTYYVTRNNSKQENDVVTESGTKVGIIKGNGIYEFYNDKNELLAYEVIDKNNVYCILDAKGNLIGTEVRNNNSDSYLILDSEGNLVKGINDVILLGIDYAWGDSKDYDLTDGSSSLRNRSSANSINAQTTGSQSAAISYTQAAYTNYTDAVKLSEKAEKAYTTAEEAYNIAKGNYDLALVKFEEAKEAYKNAGDNAEEAYKTMLEAEKNAAALKLASDQAYVEVSKEGMALIAAKKNEIAAGQGTYVGDQEWRELDKLNALILKHYVLGNNETIDNSSIKFDSWKHFSDSTQNYIKVTYNEYETVYQDLEGNVYTKSVDTEGNVTFTDSLGNLVSDVTVLAEIKQAVVYNYRDSNENVYTLSKDADGKEVYLDSLGNIVTDETIIGSIEKKPVYKVDGSGNRILVTKYYNYNKTQSSASGSEGTVKGIYIVEKQEVPDTAKIIKDAEYAYKSGNSKVVATTTKDPVTGIESTVYTLVDNAGNKVKDVIWKTTGADDKVEGSVEYALTDTSDENEIKKIEIKAPKNTKYTILEDTKETTYTYETKTSYDSEIVECDSVKDAEKQIKNLVSVYGKNANLTVSININGTITRKTVSKTSEVNWFERFDVWLTGIFKDDVMKIQVSADTSSNPNIVVATTKANVVETKAYSSGASWFLGLTRSKAEKKAKNAMNNEINQLISEGYENVKGVVSWSFDRGCHYDITYEQNVLSLGQIVSTSYYYADTLTNTKVKDVEYGKKWVDVGSAEQSLLNETTNKEYQAAVKAANEKLAKYNQSKKDALDAEAAVKKAREEVEALKSKVAKMDADNKENSKLLADLNNKLSNAKDLLLSEETKLDKVNRLVASIYKDYQAAAASLNRFKSGGTADEGQEATPVTPEVQIVKAPEQLPTTQVTAIDETPVALAANTTNNRRAATVTEIEEEEVALEADVPKDTEEIKAEVENDEDSTKIQDEATPLASTMQENIFAWWWIVLAALVIISGGLLGYRYYKSKKEVNTEA